MGRPDDLEQRPRARRLGWWLRLLGFLTFAVVLVLGLAGVAPAWLVALLPHR